MDIVIPDQWPRIRKRIQAQPLRRILFGYSRMKGGRKRGEEGIHIKIQLNIKAFSKRKVQWFIPPLATTTVILVILQGQWPLPLSGLKYIWTVHTFFHYHAKLIHYFGSILN